MANFFISYNKRDQIWAEWIAWQLEAVGYSTVIQAWDIRPGFNFVVEMQRFAMEADRTIAVLSPSYLSAKFTQPEWAAAFAKDPTGERGILVPVRVEPCELSGLLSQVVYVDLVGLNEAAAKRALLRGVMRGRQGRPTTPPQFPASKRPGLLGILKHHERNPRTDIPTRSNTDESPNLEQNPLVPAGNSHVFDVRTSSVFVFNRSLPNPTEFFGRLSERQILLERTTKGASTSIVGPRRIGKSWTLEYLLQTAPYIFGPSCRIGYINAQLPNCKTVEGFVRKTLEVLGTPAHQGMALTLETLEVMLNGLHAAGSTSVLCIDEFEAFSNHTAFEYEFFSGMRALAQDGLCLVTASKDPLIDIVGAIGNTSGFFNIFEQLTLKEFSIQEAREFVETKGSLAGFSQWEESKVLEYGQQGPLALQGAGGLLLEDKALARSTDPSAYRPDDPLYWHQFKQRLDTKLHAAIR